MNTSLSIMGPVTATVSLDKASEYLRTRMFRRSDAEEYLRSRVRIESKSIANTLDSVQLGCHFARLFKKYFPEEYQRHKNDPVTTSCISEAELSFMQLVDENLFPLDYEMLEEREYSIPIHLCGYDAQDVYENPDSFDYTVLAAIHFLGDLLDDENALNVIRDGYGELTESHPDGARLDFDKFTEACKQHGDIWAAMPDAISMLTQYTGIVFLDATFEDQYNIFQWEEDDIGKLTEEWKRALPIIKHTNDFLEWIKTIDHFKEFIALYKQFLIYDNNKTS